MSAPPTGADMLATVRSTLLSLGIEPGSKQTRQHGAMLFQAQVSGEPGFQAFKGWVRLTQSPDDVGDAELVRCWHAAAPEAPRPAPTNGTTHPSYNNGVNNINHINNLLPILSPAAGAPFVVPALPRCDGRDGTKTSRPLTEHGNAMRLFDGYADSARYVHDAQSWLVWDGTAWIWDAAGAVLRSFAGALAPGIYAEGARYLGDADHFGKWARKSQEHRTVNAAVSMLSDFAHMRLPMANIDADPLLVGLDQARRVICLRTDTTRAAAPLDYVTKSLGVATIGDASKAVRWATFLDEIFEGDAALIGWMQRFCGYLLTGSTVEQIFLFCYGRGANGKSVFVETLKFIMGDYARAIASETLSEQKRQAGGATPDLVDLIGARLVLCSETEDNSALAESLVKSLVSGDSMAVRQLYAAPVQFLPNFKLIISGNHKPIVRGSDHGIWRRVRLVPFDRTFAPGERDPQLLSKLKAEAPHILAWMVAGCIAWQRLGLADVPEAIGQATDAYQVDQDLTGGWLSENTTPSKNGRVANGELYGNYKNWCMDNGLKPTSNVALGRRLAERGYVTERDAQSRYWRGLTLVGAQHFGCNGADYENAKNGY